MARISVNSPNLISVSNKPQKSSPASKSESSKSNSPANDNLELIRRKYIIQNRSLAKNNSLSMTKISNLESKVSELITENMALRKKNSLKEIDNKKWFEEKLSLIENGVAAKFEEIFQMFRNIRSEEGLPENMSLIFPNATRSRRTTMFRPTSNDEIATGSRRKSSRRQSMLIDPERDPDIDYTTGIEIEPASVQDHDIEYEEQVNPNYVDEIDMDISSVVDASNDLDFEHHEDIDDQLGNEMIETEETKENLIHSPAKGFNLHDKPKFDVYQEEEEDSGEKKVVEKLNVAVAEKETLKLPLTEPIIGPHNSITETDQVKKLKIKKSKSNKVIEPIKDIPRLIPTEPEDSSDQPSLSADDDNIITRRSRHKTPVNYALPSLRKKMRRESEKFVDAVHLDDVEIVKVNEVGVESFVNEDNVEIKQEQCILKPNTESKTDSDKSDRKRQKIELSKAKLDVAKNRERKPLGNVTTQSHNKSNKVKELSKKSIMEKIEDIEEDFYKKNKSIKTKNISNDKIDKKSDMELIEDSLEKMRNQSIIERESQNLEKDDSIADLSIFDFVDDASKLYNSGKLERGSNKKNVAKREKRRHSMLI